MLDPVQTPTALVRYGRRFASDDIHLQKRGYQASLEVLCELANHLQKMPNSEPTIVSSALAWLHGNFGHEKSMSVHVPRRLVALCRISAASVLDVLYPSEDLCGYRAKADGEPMWVIVRIHMVCM